MKDRIKKYMEFKRISPSELADIIGVQRSNVSHVLSGRNNPGSSFIEKLLQAYPELNARWLMLGEGDMVSGGQKQSDSPAKPDLFTAPSLPGASPPEQKQPARPEKRTEPVPVVERIIIFYSDHTFTEYIPSK